MALPSRDRAKGVILEILRQSGGEIGKTKLFKVFWLAHLYYAPKAPGFLTDWPIVRMPNGPGIHCANTLIDELIAAGYVTRQHEPRGPFVEINCRLTGKEPPSDLPAPAIEAIREAVGFVKGHTAESISELSHEFSRSWNNTPNGEEMSIYTDLIPDDIYEEQERELTELAQAYDALFE